ncbi:ABC-type transport system, ATPase component [Methanocella arvoryzae MRE50]|uniref:ABC-type transport system, ATPase component n=1 Tax=Methanocella arvoryzae (strain DSM 22066 / NBRC 105507 / MRE50) TaxID=351160 RepID=Q0W8T7_METAR|nr:ABC-type transport system, ATPase component [Methanocella arvoryzae MRE50]
MPVIGVIETKDLSRSFGSVTVVDHLNMSIPSGEVFGFLGPNGAGKTTTVRMLACLIKPSGGTATVDGLDVTDEKDAMQVRSRVGLLTETPGLYDTLSAYKNLRFYGRLYDVPEQRLNDRIEYYLKLLGLWEKRDQAVGGYSKGMRQKIAIARCLLHDPKVLFLDEPTSGLDPEASHLVRDFISELKKEGRTIFLCTHNLDEADRLCDRIGIFRGHLLSVDSPSRLKDKLYGRQVVVKLKEVTPTLVNTVKAQNYVGGVEVNGKELLVRVNSPESDNPALVRALVAAGADIQFVSEASRSLEDVYFNIMGVKQ